MMELISAIAAGISGTFVMTMFMNLMSHLTGYDLRVPGILGSMITMKTKPSGKASRSSTTMTWGNIAHYVIGIVFAIIYQQILKINGMPFTWMNGLVFGFFAGIVAVIYWFTFIKLHPLAPAVKLKYYLISIFIAHIFLGAGIYAGFKLLSLVMDFPTDN